MISLMQEIKTLKDKNKDISDEERRKNAENIIMKLAQFMDLSDGSGSEDELDN
jgi:hypothetical protein